MNEINSLEQLKDIITNLSEEQKQDESIQKIILAKIAYFFKLTLELSVEISNNKTNNGLTRDQNSLKVLSEKTNILKECSDTFSQFPLSDNIRESFTKIQPDINEIALSNAGMVNINAMMTNILQEAAEKNKQKQSSGCFGVIIFLLGLSGGLLYFLMH